MADMASIASESFDHAMRSFQEVVQTATKLQEESVKGLQEMLSAAALPAWQKRAQGVVNDIMAVAQTNTDETLQAMEQNLKTGMELWQKAFESRPDKPQTNVQEGTIGFWQTMAGLLRTNTETMMRANSRIVTTWMELGKMANVAQGGETAPTSESAQPK
jgi:hypothetical protein